MEGYFDSLGNITAVTDNNGNTVSYTYDYLGQLVGETNTNGSYTVTYDDRGNITQKDGKNYIYGNSAWQDQLTNYNGTAIAYDAIGNPNNWRDGMTLGWTNGRQLYHANQTGGNDAWYHYDSAGIRTSKTVNADYVDFTYVDGKLVYQENHESSWWFYYNATDNLVAMEYNENLYYYMYDSIGNIIGLMDTNGVEVATYTYDAWGKILSATGSMAEINPMRYKGYYYDTETGYYYLMSRYYDPVVGRFLNADGFAGTGQGVLGYNMFAYCGNNPVSRADTEGKFWNIVAGAIVGGVVNLVTSVVSEVIEGDFEWSDLGQIISSTAIGAAEGALIAVFPAASAGISAAASALDSAIDGAIDGKHIGEIAYDAAVSATIGFVAGSAGSDFVKGGKILNSAAEAAGKVLKKSVTPAARKALMKEIRMAGKYIAKSYVSNQVESLCYNGINKFSQWYTKAWFKEMQMR